MQYIKRQIMKLCNYDSFIICLRRDCLQPVCIASAGLACREKTDLDHSRDALCLGLIHLVINS